MCIVPDSRAEASDPLLEVLHVSLELLDGATAEMDDRLPNLVILIEGSEFPFKNCINLRFI